jgi:hypothetical protein
MFYTYAHYKPNGGLFYIGKGQRRRSRDMYERNSHWKNIVNKYGKPSVELLAKWETEQEAFEHEKFLISCFRDMGIVLANKTDGGDGTSGFKFNDEQKKRLADAHLGQVAWNKGLKGVTTAWNKGQEATENQKIAVSKMLTCSCGKTGKIGSMTRWHMDNCGVTFPYSARVTVDGVRFQIGRFKTKEEAKACQDQYIKEHNVVRKPPSKRTTPAWNKGKRMSDESKAKLSDALKGRKVWNKGLKSSDETRMKQRLAKLGKPSNRRNKVKEELLCPAQ